MATQRGSSPTGISSILLLTSFPLAFLTLIIDTLLASRLTTTRRCSSEVKAIVVERVGAASAFLGAVIASEPIRTAATAINRVALPQYGAGKLRGFDVCEFFMYISPDVFVRNQSRPKVRMPPSFHSAWRKHHPISGKPDRKSVV